LALKILKRVLVFIARVVKVRNDKKESLLGEIELVYTVLIPILLLKDTKDKDRHSANIIIELLIYV
jgi:hypothetical protein